MSSSSSDDEELEDYRDDEVAESLPANLTVTDEHFEVAVVGKSLVLQCRVPGV
jgi:hypothetical protein